jgi:hypothetical protein
MGILLSNCLCEMNAVMIDAESGRPDVHTKNVSFFDCCIELSLMIREVSKTISRRDILRDLSGNLPIRLIVNLFSPVLPAGVFITF